MFTLQGVGKSFGTFRRRRAVLVDISVTFETGKNYVILGDRQAGKSTLLRLLAGTSRPTRGRILRLGRTSIPIGEASRVAPYKTPRQLIDFLSVIYDTDPAKVIAAALALTRVDRAAFDVPFPALPRAIQIKLNIALGYILPADIFLIDNAIGWGDETFRDRCKVAFDARRRSAVTLLATADIQGAEQLGERGGVLINGNLHLYTTVAEAVQVFLEIKTGQAEGILAYAERLAKNGEHTAAIAYLEQFIGRSNTPAAAYDMLVDLHVASGDIEGASAAANAAIHSGVQAAKPLLLLSRAAAANGRVEESISLAEAALAAEPSNAEVTLYLARAYEKAGDFYAAGEIWSKIAERDGNVKAARQGIVDFARASDWPRVMAASRAYLAYDPNDVSVREALAKACFEENRWQEANTAVAELAHIDGPRAIRLIYTLVKTPEWVRILDLLGVVHDDVINSEKSAHTLTHLRAFLSRQANILEREGQPQLASRVRERLVPVVSTVEQP